MLKYTKVRVKEEVNEHKQFAKAPQSGQPPPEIGQPSMKVGNHPLKRGHEKVQKHVNWAKAQGSS